MNENSSVSVNPYSGQALQTGTSLNNSSKSTSTSELLSEFKSMMMLMMLSSMNMSGGSSMSGLGLSDDSGSSSLSSLGGGTGMNMSSIMAPLMMSLLEKLMAQQVETEPAAQAVQAVQDSPQGMPVEGAVLTQGSHAGHVALDFGIPVGSPVKATMDGEVVYAGWNDEGYGNLVIVQNGNYKTYFAHLSKIPVEVGQTVHAGEVVGKSGNTGNSTGPHLHYEVRKNGEQIDPSSFTLE
jgi:murein DD-endopeptidase MepM/ murein hydrolase activator NlpD